MLYCRLLCGAATSSEFVSHNNVTGSHIKSHKSNANPARVFFLHWHCRKLFLKMSVKLGVRGSNFGRVSAHARQLIKLQTQLQYKSAGDTEVTIQRDNELLTISLIFASNELVQVRSTLKYATEIISGRGLNENVVLDIAK